jgi:hypothetical protein
MARCPEQAIQRRAAPKQGQRQAYVVTLVPAPGVDDPIRSLRHALKRLKRSYGLRAISVAEARR